MSPGGASPLSEPGYPLRGALLHLAELLRYKHLLWNLVGRDLKVKYKNSVLGYLWSLMNPLIMLIVYSIAFGYIIGIRTGDVPFAIYFICGFLPWSFLQMSMSMSATSIVDNFNLVTKIYFPREILPVSVVFSNLVQFLLTFVVLFPALWIAGCRPSWTWLVTPLPVLMLLAFTVGVSLIVSAMNVLYRDVKHFIEIFLNIWFWSAPIVYPISLVEKRLPDWLMKLYVLNPLTVHLDLFREVTLYGRMPPFSSWALAFAFDLLLFAAGFAYFRRRSCKFAEYA